MVVEKSTNMVYVTNTVWKTYLKDENGKPCLDIDTDCGEIDDNETVYVAFDKLFHFLRKWDLATGQLLRTWPSMVGVMEYHGFLGAEFVVCSDQNRLALWDLEKDSIRCIHDRFCPYLLRRWDKIVLLIVPELPIKLWRNIDEDSSIFIDTPLTITALMKINNNLIIGNQGGDVNVWDIRDGQFRFKLKWHIADIMAMGEVNDSICTVCKGRGAAFWDIQTGAKLRTCIINAESVSEVAIYPEYFVTFSTTNEIRVFDIKTAQLLCIFTVPSDIQTFRLFDKYMLVGIKEYTTIIEFWRTPSSVFALVRLLRIRDGDGAVAKEMMKRLTL